MNLYRTGVIALTLLLFSACSSTPDPAAVDADQEIIIVDADTMVHASGDGSGLGPIDYNPRAQLECGRLVRTGSRIPRSICTPDSYNGLFPSGTINMGTAGESQKPYGKN
jgi:hypothetical protein